VATIKPFKALRPSPEKAAEVSSVPYDVIYESEVRDTVAHNPLTFLRVTRPDGEFPEGASPSSAQMFEVAKRNLDAMRADATLVDEKEESVYVYRLTAGAHSQTGIVACCSVDEYEADIVKRHEKTRPDKVEDRTDHMLEVGAQTGLVFLAFRGTSETRRLVSETVATAPLYDFTAADGVRHTVWKMSSSGEIVDAFKEVPAIYIADGHHRVESARLARTKKREASAAHDGSEEYNYFIAGIFPSEDLAILPYNRAVRDLNGLSEEDFLGRVSEVFTVMDAGEKVPKVRGEVCMYLGGRWRTLHSNADNVQEAGPIERLDVSILQNSLLAPILGIDDPRTDERITFVGGARGTDELEKLVDSGKMKVAFSMFATTMDDLFAVSDIGEIMPPKSTWFEPKLRDGLLVHCI
jgi:uncharacterized protein (DUF1015 family)